MSSVCLAFVACAAFCLLCAVDESSGEEMCMDCKDGYGPKNIYSKTCDGETYALFLCWVSKLL